MKSIHKFLITFLFYFVPSFLIFSHLYFIIHKTLYRPSLLSFLHFHISVMLYYFFPSSTSSPICLLPSISFPCIFFLNSFHDPSLLSSLPLSSFPSLLYPTLSSLFFTLLFPFPLLFPYLSSLSSLSFSHSPAFLSFSFL